ncbi:uncharacterized protein M6B38_131200 [Iris pallida]|uniref:Uncharacterized protein n=1 Tax=Iris pallida TaxID=29817 RepID=A0AAX6G0G8_IRIPA|nr:uncharacterized protein M6B38_131200 [Iris pallida]
MTRETEREISHLEEDVNSSIESVVHHPCMVGQQLGQRDEPGRRQVRVQRNLRQVAIQKLRHLQHRALFRRPLLAIVLAAPAALVDPPSLLLLLLLQVQEHREDPHHCLRVVELAATGRRYQHVLQNRLVQLHPYPPLQVPPARGGGGDRRRGLEQAGEERDRHGAPPRLRRQQPRDGLQDRPLLPLRLRARGLDVPTAEAVERGVRVDDQDPPYGLLLQPPGLERREQPLEEVEAQRAEGPPPPVRRLLGFCRRGRLQARVALELGQPGGELLLADVGGDGGDDAGDQADLFGRGEEGLAVVEGGDGAGDAREHGLPEEGLRAELEVVVGELLGHLEVVGGAAERGGVGEGEVDGDPVAELGGELEGLRAAGHSLEAHPDQLRVFGLGHDLLELATPRYQRKLHNHIYINILAN